MAVAETISSFFSPSVSSKPQVSQIPPVNQAKTQPDTFKKPQLPMYSQPSFLSQLQEMYKQKNQDEAIPLVPQSIDLIGGWSRERD